MRRKLFRRLLSPNLYWRVLSGLITCISLVLAGITALEVSSFNRGLTNLVFAQPAASRQQAEPLIAYLRSLPAETRPKTFAVVALDDPFTLGVMEGLKPKLLADGLELLLDEVYAAETSDFSAIATQLARLDPDLIIGGTQQEDSVAQIRGGENAVA